MCPSDQGALAAEEDNPAMISLLPFGRTGHQSTRIIFGAAALAPSASRMPMRPSS